MEERPDHAAYYPSEDSEMIELPEEQMVLFGRLFRTVKSQIPEAIVRGNASIRGVSRPDERYLFYVSYRGAGWQIKFRHQAGTFSFDKDCLETLLNFTKQEIKSIREHPEDFVITRKRVERDKRPLSEIYGALPADYDGIPVSSDIFSDRVSRLLQKYGIRTLGALLCCSEADLRKLPQFGSRAMKEVRFILEQVFCEGSQPQHEEETEDNYSNYQNSLLIGDLFPTGISRILLREGITTLSALLDTNLQTLLAIPDLGLPALSEVFKTLIPIAEEQGIRAKLPQQPGAGVEPPQNPKQEVREQMQNLLNEFRSELLRLTNMVPSAQHPAHDADDFYLRLKLWTQRMINEHSGIIGQDREILFRHALNKERLSSIGEEKNLTRERIRQICSRAAWNFIAAFRNYPTQEYLEKLEEFIGFFRNLNDEERFLLLRDAGKKNRNLLKLLLQIFLNRHETRNLLSAFSRSRKKPPQSVIEPYETEYDCPVCGEPLLFYTAKKGPNKGKECVGCSAFPFCTFEETPLEQFGP